MFKKFLLASSTAALFVAPVAKSETTATARPYSTGVKISPLGLGLQAKYAVNNTFGIRADVNGFRLNKNLSDKDLDYKAKLRLLTAGVYADWHPFQNGFALSAGLAYNGNKFELKASPARNVTMDGRTYTPAQMGHIKGTADFRKVSPYVGLSYETSRTEKGFSFHASAGVLFQGKARVSISADGQAANDQAFLDDLKNDATEALDKPVLKYFPVVSLGVIYRF